MSSEHDDKDDESCISTTESVLGQECCGQCSGLSVTMESLSNSTEVVKTVMNDFASASGDADGDDPVPQEDHETPGVSDTGDATDPIEECKCFPRCFRDFFHSTQHKCLNSTQMPRLFIIVF